MSAYTGLRRIASNARGITLQVSGGRILSSPASNPPQGAASRMLSKACRAYPKATAWGAPAIRAIDCSYAPESEVVTFARRPSIIGHRPLSGNAVDINIDLASPVERLGPD